MALENQMESIFRSVPLQVEITIQKINRGGNNPHVPGAVNYYRGVVEFGKKTKFHKIFEKNYWRTLWWHFSLGGLVEMGFLDPYQFNKLNYELDYRGEEMLLGRRCWVYRVRPKDHAKGWHFEGAIWVLVNDLTIIRFQGAFHPMHKIHWLFLVEDFWFSFDSWRKEISLGVWAPDFTCTGVGVAESDFIEPAFRARIRYFPEGGGKPGASSENACGMELGYLPVREMQKYLATGETRK